MRRIYGSLVVTLVLLLVPCIFARAQQRSITGTIKKDTGMPLPGVNILLKGTTNGVTTTEGGYAIKASQGDVIV